MSTSENQGGAAKDESTEVAAEGGAMAVPGRRRRDEDPEEGGSRRGLAIVIPLVMAAAAIVGLVLVGMRDNAIYSKPVDELVAAKDKFAGRTVRVEGNLVHGSLTKRETPCEYRFTIEKNGTQLPVSYPKCVVPDTFRDVPGMDVSVTVEGSLLANNSFEASTVLAKCPSKYEMKDRAQKGEAMPHAATEPGVQSAYGTP